MSGTGRKISSSELIFRRSGVISEQFKYSKIVESVCCLLVLNLVSSTHPCIRQPGPRIRVLGVCDLV
jgi:hypothetical protein